MKGTNQNESHGEIELRDRALGNQRRDDSYEVRLPSDDDDNNLSDELPAKATDTDQALLHDTPNPAVYFARRQAGKLRETSTLHRTAQVAALLYSLLVSGLSATLYALTAPSGKNPSQLSGDWWQNMSASQRAHAVFNALFTLPMMTLVWFVFLLNAAAGIKINISEMRRNPALIIRDTVALVFGIGIGMAMSDIVYGAFSGLPAGTYLALVPGGFAFGVTSIAGYLSCNNLFKRIQNGISNDNSAKQKFSRTLLHVHPDHKDQVQHRFRITRDNVLTTHSDLNTVTDAEMDEIAREFAKAFHDYVAENRDLGVIQPESCWEIAYRYSSIFRSLISLSTTTPIFFVILEKGFGLVADLARLGKPESFTNVDGGSRVGIGLISGLAGVINVMDANFEFGESMPAWLRHLNQNRKQIPGALLMVTAAIIASSAMQGVAQSVVSNPTNILGVRPGTDWGDGIATTAAIASITMLMNSGMSLYREQPKKIELTFERLARHLSLSRFAVSHETAQAFRRYALHAAPPTQDSSTVQPVVRAENASAPRQAV